MILKQIRDNLAYRPIDEKAHLVLSEQAPRQPVDGDCLANLLSLKARVDRHYHHKYSSCSCSCHRKPHVLALPVLKGIAGALNVSFSTIPVWRPVCDIQRCHSRKKSIINGRYFFPRWFYSRVVYFSLISSKRKGPELLLRVCRIISRNGSIFHCILSNDFTGVRHLYGNGEAFPYDIDEDRNWTPLIVSS